MNDTVATVSENWVDSGLNFDRFVDDMFKGISNLSDPTQVKNRLRAKIAEHLVANFAFPELIDGLTEFLMEILAQDTSKKTQFGIP